jgi:hypothetical protein
MQSGWADRVRIFGVFFDSCDEPFDGGLDSKEGLKSALPNQHGLERFSRAADGAKPWATTSLTMT